MAQPKKPKPIARSKNGPKVIHRYKAAHKRGNKPGNDKDCNETIPRGYKQDEIEADCKCGARDAKFKWDGEVVPNVLKGKT